MPDIDVVSISERDLDLLKQVIKSFREGSLNPRTPPSVEGGPGQAPDTYAALTPSGGIPALAVAFSGTGTGTGGDSCSSPGHADCKVYQVIGDTSESACLREVPGLIRPVLNMAREDVPGDTFVLIEKDKFGRWWANSTNQSLVVTYVSKVCPVLQAVDFGGSVGTLTIQTGEVVEYTTKDIIKGTVIARRCVTNQTGCCGGGGSGSGTPNNCCTNPTLCATLTNTAGTTGNLNGLAVLLNYQGVIDGNGVWQSAWTPVTIVLNGADPGYNGDMAVRLTLLCISDSGSSVGYFGTIDFRYSIGANPPVVVSFSFSDALTLNSSNCDTLSLSSHAGIAITPGESTFYMTTDDFTHMKVDVTTNVDTCGSGTGTGCCEDTPPPSMLTLTITDDSGCSCLAGGYPLLFDPSALGGLGAWTHDETLCGQPVTFILFCSNGTWTLDYIWGESAEGHGFSSVTCSPFSAMASSVPIAIGCTGTIDITVTE